MAKKGDFSVKMVNGKDTVYVQVSATCRKNAEGKALVQGGPGYKVVGYSKMTKARSGNKPWRYKPRHRIGHPAPKPERSIYRW